MLGHSNQRRRGEAVFIAVDRCLYFLKTIAPPLFKLGLALLISRLLDFNFRGFAQRLICCPRRSRSRLWSRSCNCRRSNSSVSALAESRILSMRANLPAAAF